MWLLLKMTSWFYPRKKAASDDKNQQINARHQNYRRTPRLGFLSGIYFAAIRLGFLCYHCLRSFSFWTICPKAKRSLTFEKHQNHQILSPLQEPKITFIYRLQFSGYEIQATFSSKSLKHPCYKKRLAIRLIQLKKTPQSVQYIEEIIKVTIPK